MLSSNSKEVFYADLDLDSVYRQSYYEKLLKKDSWTIFHQKLNWKLTFKISAFFIIGLIGMVASVIKRNKKAYLFLFVLWYVLSVTSAIEEGTVTRYRIPLDPYVFLFASYSVYFLVELVKTINKKYEECLIKE